MSGRGPPLLYWDRARGALAEERIFGERTLRLLYETRRGRALAPLLHGGLFHRLYGRVQRSSGSRAHIAAFAAELGIDVSEAELPLEAYPTLDAFFARRLRPGARPVERDPTRLVAPSDGRALAFPALAGGALPVKGAAVSVETLLGDGALARRFHGGAALVVRLAPADYHRFHFPDDGLAGPARAVPGPLRSVHPIALRSGAASFENRRVVTLLESRGFGPLAMVEVGALAVGTIVESYAPGPVRRGEEKGTFRFGGSTVVLLARPGRLSLDPDLVAQTANGIETLVRMGTGVGRASRTEEP